MPTKNKYHFKNNTKSGTAIKVKYCLILSVDYFSLPHEWVINNIIYVSFASVLSFIILISVSRKLISLDLQTMSRYDAWSISI